MFGVCANLKPVMESLLQNLGQSFVSCNVLDGSILGLASVVTSNFSGLASPGLLAVAAIDGSVSTFSSFLVDDDYWDTKYLYQL